MTWARVLRRTVRPHIASNGETVPGVYDVQLELSPHPPPPAHILIAFISCPGSGAPVDISTNPWTLGGWVAGIGEPYQHGGGGAGPPYYEAIGWYYRAVVPGEAASVLSLSGALVEYGAHVWEIAGCDVAGIVSTDGLDGVIATPFTHTLTASAGLNSAYFGGIGYAKIDYDGGWGTPCQPSNWVVATNGTELANASRINDCGGAPPWHWVGYATGVGTLTVGARFVLDGPGTAGAYSSIAIGHAGLLIPITGTFGIVQQAVGGVSLPGSDCNVTLPSPPS
jgi:hypothetical protein